jgi:hypothetical protein
VAIAQNNFYLTVRNYTFDLDTTAWGWIHVALGAVLLLTGIFLMSGQAWAAVTGIVLAGLSAINNFFLPYYPLWSIVTIAGDVFVIWALARMLNMMAGSEPDAWSPPTDEQRWPRAGSTARSRTDVKPASAQAEQTTPTTGGQPAGQQGSAPYA